MTLMRDNLKAKCGFMLRFDDSELKINDLRIAK